jgi:hypothetical protein
MPNIVLKADIPWVLKWYDSGQEFNEMAMSGTLRMTASSAPPLTLLTPLGRTSHSAAPDGI